MNSAARFSGFGKSARTLSKLSILYCNKKTTIFFQKISGECDFLKLKKEQQSEGNDRRNKS